MSKGIILRRLEEVHDVAESLSNALARGTVDASSAAFRLNDIRSRILMLMMDWPLT